MATIATLSVLLEAKGQRAFIGDMTKVTAAITAAVIASGKLAERGGKILTVQDAFTRHTHRQVDALTLLRAASQGLVSDYDLMVQANTAFTLGAARSAEEMALLTEGATQLGRALGLETTFALQSLVGGLARGEKEILDNLGLLVSQAEANRRYATSLGIAESALTDVQRREAFRAEGLRQLEIQTQALGNVTLNAGDAYRQFTVELQNTTDALAQNAANSLVLEGAFRSLTAWTLILRGDLEGVKDLYAGIAEEEAKLAERLARTDRGTGTFGASIEEMRAQMVAFEEQAAAFRASVDETKAFHEELRVLNSMIVDVTIPAINPLTGGLLDFGDTAARLSDQHLPQLEQEIRETYFEFLAYTVGVNAADEANKKFASSLSRVGAGLGALGGFAGLFGIQIPFLSNITSGLGGLFSLDRLLPDLFGGEGKAMGGPVTAGRPYTVGERGPELFVPQTSGTIVPSGGLTVTVNMSRPANRSQAIRDAEWQRELAEGLRTLFDSGFSFA